MTTRFLLIVSFLLLPFFAFAQSTTLSDLETKIAALLSQIQTLQTELQTLKTEEATETPQASVSSSSFTTTLGKGSEGANVTRLQQYLASDPTLYPEGLITGYFGSLTEAAVKRFQTKHNIVSSGTPLTTGYGHVGPATRAKLNALLTSSSPTPTPTPPPTPPPTTPNRSPNLSITGSRTLTLPNKATLTALATDDGLPVRSTQTGLPTNSLTYFWSKASGPGTATFSSLTTNNTTITFSSAGTYQITATVSDGDLFASYTIALTALPPSTTATTTPATTTPVTLAPTLAFTASQTSLTKGNSTTLTWSSTNALSCSATQGPAGSGVNWSGSKTSSGSTTLTPTTTTTYTLTCKGGGGDAVAKSVTITVTNPIPAPVAQKKFYPGLWALLGTHRINSPRPLDLTVIEGKDYYVGVERSYEWSDIESEYGVYDFSAIKTEKAMVAATGRKLAVELKWLNAGGCTSCNPRVPRYMWDDPSYGGTVPGKYGSYLGGSGNDTWIAMTWNPKVQARINALLNAFALAFDDDPDIALVLLEQETTHGATTADDPGYTCAKEIQAIKDILTYAYARFPHTPVFYELDWTCTDTPSALHQFLIDGGHGAWTIDARPHNIGPGPQADRNSYSFYRDQYSKIAGAIFLDGWTDINRWPGYQTAAQILAELGLGKILQPRYFLVDQTNSPNQAEINQAVGEWWNDHGGVWPFSDLPSSWK